MIQVTGNNTLLRSCILHRVSCILDRVSCACAVHQTMKVTVNWLKEYVDLEGLSPQELAEGLTMAGLEVEAVEPLGRELAGIVVGKILEVVQHPEADKLTLCQVDTGQVPVDIVCGAPNVRPGLTGAGSPARVDHPRGADHSRSPDSQGDLPRHALFGTGNGTVGRSLRNNGPARGPPAGHPAQPGPGTGRHPAGGQYHPQPGRLPEPLGHCPRTGGHL